MANPFRVGQLVRYLRPSNAWVTQGKVYRVEAAGRDWVEVLNDQGRTGSIRTTSLALAVVDPQVDPQEVDPWNL